MNILKENLDKEMNIINTESNIILIVYLYFSNYFYYFYDQDNGARVS